MKRKERVIFKTLVNTRLMEVWVRNETHSLGKMNGTRDNWWLKQTYSDTDEFDWVPWCDIGSNRNCFGVEIKQGNRTKCKWGETQIRGFTTVNIKHNDQVVYSYGCRDIEYALAKAQVTITQMMEHPFKFSDPESEIGRKIWYRNQPAFIESLVLSQGAIMIRHAKGEDFVFDDAWRTEEDQICDREWGSLVKDDIFTDKIWWFRNDDTQPVG